MVLFSLLILWPSGLLFDVSGLVSVPGPLVVRVRRSLSAAARVRLLFGLVVRWILFSVLVEDFFNLLPGVLPAQAVEIVPGVASSKYNFSGSDCFPGLVVNAVNVGVVRGSDFFNAHFVFPPFML